jgi:hypothetical protein
VEAEALLAWTVVPVAAVLVVGAVAVLLLRGTRCVAALAVLGFVAPMTLIFAAEPVVRASYPWQRFGAQIARAPAPACIYQFRTPSLTFYARQPVLRITDPAKMAELINRPGPAWVVVNEGMLDSGPLARRIAARTGAVIDRAGPLALVRLS